MVYDAYYYVAMFMLLFLVCVDLLKIFKEKQTSSSLNKNATAHLIGSSGVVCLLLDVKGGRRK